MLSLTHRVLFIIAILFFTAIGFVIMASGDPSYIKPLVSEDVYKIIQPGSEVEPNTMYVALGALLIIIIWAIALFGGLFVPFSKKVSIPKKVDVLRAQDSTVFLVDGKVYKREEAVFYNLEDLGRIRKVITKNLYWMDLDEEIRICKKGDNNEDTTSDRNSKKGAVGEEGSNKEQDSEGSTDQ